jgi:hypothetical protein
MPKSPNTLFFSRYFPFTLTHSIHHPGKLTVASSVKDFVLTVWSVKFEIFVLGAPSLIQTNEKL